MRRDMSIIFNILSVKSSSLSRNKIKWHLGGQKCVRHSRVTHLHWWYLGVFNRDWHKLGDATVRHWQSWYLFVATLKKKKNYFTEAYIFHRNSCPIISVRNLNFVLKQKEGTWVLQETEAGKTVLFITQVNLVNLVSYPEVFSLFL